MKRETNKSYTHKFTGSAQAPREHVFSPVLLPAPSLSNVSEVRLMLCLCSSYRLAAC